MDCSDILNVDRLGTQRFSVFSYLCCFYITLNLFVADTESTPLYINRISCRRLTECSSGLASVSEYSPVSLLVQVSNYWQPLGLVVLLRARGYVLVQIGCDIFVGETAIYVCVGLHFI